jgi:hypothetical protein
LEEKQVATVKAKDVRARVLDGVASKIPKLINRLKGEVRERVRERERG